MEERETQLSGGMGRILEPGEMEERERAFRGMGGWKTERHSVWGGRGGF